MTQARSLQTRAAHLWVPLVVLVAVALGGIAVVRLRGVFGSDTIFSATSRDAAPLTPFHVKTVVYEIDGPAMSTGTVAYLDANAKPAQSGFVNLPWHLTISTTQPVVIANVVAQGDADHLTCRIIVEGVIQDQHQTSGHHAQTFCLVKAA